MRIGILSDTHLNKVNSQFVGIFEKYLSDTDLILHAGDIVSSEVVEYLSKMKFHGVHGNMDPEDVKSMLPEKKIIEIGNCRIGLIHGAGAYNDIEERILLEFEKVDVIVYGHSHHAANGMKEGILLFNPGTATGFSSSGNNSVGILEINEGIKGQIISV